MADEERDEQLALTPTGDAPGLRDFIRILLQRKWVLVLIAVLAVVASLGYSKVEKPVYTGTTQLLLTPLLSTSLLQATNLSVNTAQNTVDVPTDTEVIESRNVQAYVGRSIKDPPKVSVFRNRYHRCRKCVRRFHKSTDCG